MPQQEGALAALRKWLEQHFDGNLESFELQTDFSGRQVFSGQVGYTYDWEQSRERAEGSYSSVAINEQMDAALSRRSLFDGLMDAIQASPRDWLRDSSGFAIPGYTFQQSRCETCDSCKGNRTVTCGNCRGSGKVTCHRCNGSGTERVMCNGCGGVGYHRRTRQVQVHVGDRYEYQTEYYNDNCWGCGGSGRKDGQCSNCHGSGTDSCSPCSGSGRVMCADCRGAGQRNYLYTRTAIVRGTCTLNLESVERPSWRDLLQTRWLDMLRFNSVSIDSIQTGTEQQGVFTVPFAASAEAVEATVHSSGAAGKAASIGSEHAVASTEDIITRALDIRQCEDADGWASQADALAGKRLLREAVDASEKASVGFKGTKEQIRSAQHDAIVSAMRERYGFLLDTGGAAAVAGTVIEGIGNLSLAAARKVWLNHLALATVIGLVAAVAAIVVIASQETVFEKGFRTAFIIALSTLAGGIVWALVGRMRVRSHLKRLSGALGLDTPLSPPSHGWSSRGGVLTFLSVAATFGVVAYSCYALGIPETYRLSWDRQFGYAEGNSLYGNAVDLRSDTIMYRWPDSASQQLTQLPSGTTVDVLHVPDAGAQNAGEGDWVLARFERNVGYVAAGALGY